MEKTKDFSNLYKLFKKYLVLVVSVLNVLFILISNVGIKNEVIILTSLFILPLLLILFSIYKFIKKERFFISYI